MSDSLLWFEFLIDWLTDERKERERGTPSHTRRPPHSDHTARIFYSRSNFGIVSIFYLKRETAAFGSEFQVMCAGLKLNHRTNSTNTRSHAYCRGKKKNKKEITSKAGVHFTQMNTKMRTWSNSLSHNTDFKKHWDGSIIRVDIYTLNHMSHCQISSVCL